MSSLNEKILSVDTKLLKWIKRVLVVIALALYVFFLYLDFKGGRDTSAIKYIALLTCVLISCCHFQQWTGRITILAMILTAIADAFLLLAGKNYSTGITIFCVVQLLYFIRLRMSKPTKGLVKAILLRVAMLAILAVFVILFQVKNKQAILAAGYFLLLLSNMMDSASLAEHDEDRGSMFTWGLVLFILCDICVGLSNFDSDIVDYVRKYVEFGMWLFYLPSQLLIAASAGRFKLVERAQARMRGEYVPEDEDEAEEEEPVAEAAKPARKKLFGKNEKKTEAQAAVTAQEHKPAVASTVQAASAAQEVQPAEEPFIIPEPELKIEPERKFEPGDAIMPGAQGRPDIDLSRPHEPNLVFDDAPAATAETGMTEVVETGETVDTPTSQGVTSASALGDQN